MATKKDTRIVYFGTPDFAVEGLKQLVENEYSVVGVVTVPDKPAGRGQRMTQSAVKRFATTHDLPILQPEKLKSSDFIDKLKQWNADIFVVVAFRMLPEVVWSMPRFGTFNLHASLLPQYRGAAPINWAIINGETETGVTSFFINHKIDTGAIILQEKTPILPDDNAETVHDKLMLLGGKIIKETVDLIIETNGNAKTIAQEHIAPDNLKSAPKIFKQDCKINWQQPATKIYNFIRGLSPYPSAWTSMDINGKNTEIKIFASDMDITPHSLPAGTIQTDYKSYFKIATTDGFISILELQPQSKKRMPVKAFLNGIGNSKPSLTIH